MSLILKQEPANTIATPPAGKSTLFVDDNSVMSVKNPAGTVTTFPTVQGSNTQVFFNDEGAINGSANLAFVKTTNTLTLTNGNVVATGVKTDNLYYANGNPWDLQQPAGSNTQLQFNNNDSFGASANLTFDGTSLNTTANLNVTGNAYISGNLTVDGNVVYVNVESLSVEDPLIALGGGPNGNALTSNNGYDRGLILHNYTTQAVDAFMGWDTSNAEFSFASNVSVAGEVVTINTLGNIRASNIAGTLSTAAQPNITSVGTLTGLLIGATSLQADFPNAKAIISQDNSGQTHSENIGVVGEAVADSGNTSTWGIGVLGEARANGATKATGVQGGGYVTNSADTGAAVGVRGYSVQTHSGGYNIGVLGNASGSGLGSYAFYVQAGNIGSIETTTNWELIDDEAAALTFSSTGKANIFGIETTDGAEGIYTQGYLNVTGNAAVGGLLTNNLYYANGSPWDLQQAGGSNTQIQFNDADNFGGSAAFTFNKTSNTVQIGNALSVVGNANIGNIGTGGLVTATGNVIGGNITTGGVVTATGNVSGANLIAGAKVLATGNVESQANITAAGIIAAVGNVSGGNIITAGVVFATGNVSGGNLTTGGVLSVTGNANVGNLGTAGLITATGNVRGGNLETLGKVVANGNIESGANAVIESQLYVGNNAYLVSLTNPVIIGSANGESYVQGALVNKNANGSADWVSYGDNGNTDAGWADFGFTGSTFNDANYTITGKNDGYFFVQSVNGTGLGGNLVLATGSQGANNDIVFATGGFLTANEKMRFVSAEGAFKIKTTTVATNTTTGALVVSGGAGIAGNVYSGGLLSATGNITGGNLTTTGTANVGNLNVTGNVTSALLPNANVTYDLGSDTQRWKDLYLANSTIYLGNATMTANGNSVSTSGNLTSANLRTAGTLSVGGNANIGNIGTGGLITATGNIGGGNINTGGVVSATGNVTGGNLNTVGNVNSSIMVNGGTGIYLSAGPAGYINFFTTGGDKATITDTGNIAASNLIANSTVFAVTANVSGNVNAGNVSATTFTGALSGAATTAGTVTTNAQPNITSVGTLTTVSVSGNANIGNIGTGGLITATGNLNAGNIITGGIVSATGNGTFGNVTATTFTGALSGAATTAGTVTTAAQPNITSVGTLSAVSVSGNANVGNLGTAGLLVAIGNVTGGNLVTGGLVSATGNIVSSANVVTDLIVGKTTGVTITATGTNQNINLVPTGSGSVNVGNFIISNLAAPVADTDAATKKYVDDVSQGLNIHDSCQAATPTTLATITGGTITYNNGASGVGANLTTTGSFNLIDGVNVQTSGTRILVKNEANAVYNGIYTWSNATVITRATDFNSVPEVEAGDFVFVTGGTLYDNTGWVQINSPAGIGGASDVIEFTQFSGAGTYTAGTGLTLLGSQFSITNTTVSAGSYGNGDYNATFTVNGQGQLTAAANVALTPNAANLSGTTLKSTVVNSSLTSVGTLTTLSVSGNANVGNIGAAAGVFTTVAGSLTTAAQPNITSVGTLTSLAVTGNISAGNVSATTFTGALSGAATTAGTVTTAAQPNITSVGTLTSLGVNGTVTAVAFTANTGVFTGNGSGLSAIAGANVTGTVSSATTAGTVTTAAQPNITSVGTLSSLTVSGNAGANHFNATNSVVASTLVSNVATGTAPLTVTSTTRVNNLNVAYANVADNINVSAPGTGTAYIVGANATTGNVAEWTSSGISMNLATNAITATTFIGALSGAATSATTAGTVTTAAQPNITSVGTLTSLAVTGNITAGNASVTGQLVSTVATGTAPLVVTSTTQVANLNVATAGVAGTVSGAAQGNITSLGTLSSLSVSGNANVGNIGATNIVGTITTASQTNITSVGTLGSLSVSGNINAGNIIATHYGAATGLTGIPGANVSGTVANATYAVTAGTAGTAGVAGTVSTAAQPNITSVGTLTSLTLSGTLTGAVQIGTGAATHFGTTLTTGANTTAGTIVGNWTLSTGSKLNATYADLAEKYTADANYEPGTVLVFGGEHEVTLSTDSDSFRVAGVVTTNPAYTMNDACEGEHVATIALQGRVPVKVIGPVYKGDLLVSCGNGHAIANNIARAGTIIGKSLENFNEATGIIEVAVGRF